MKHGTNSNSFSVVLAEEPVGNCFLFGGGMECTGQSKSQMEELSLLFTEM